MKVISRRVIKGMSDVNQEGITWHSNPWLHNPLLSLSRWQFSVVTSFSFSSRSVHLKTNQLQKLDHWAKIRKFCLLCVMNILKQWYFSRISTLKKNSFPIKSFLSESLFLNPPFSVEIQSIRRHLVLLPRLTLKLDKNGFRSSLRQVKWRQLAVSFNSDKEEETQQLMKSYIFV